MEGGISVRFYYETPCTRSRSTGKIALTISIRLIMPRSEDAPNVEQFLIASDVYGSSAKRHQQSGHNRALQNVSRRAKRRQQNGPNSLSWARRETKQQYQTSPTELS